MTTLSVSDETATGASIHQWTIADVPDLLPVGEIIRLRVREEVARYNLGTDDRYQGLVTPTWTEVTVNGQTSGRRIDWERQAEIAILAFARNGFFVLVDDHQVTSLDEVVDLRRTQRVSFIRLVPLAGG
jgi:hypothetical protein